MAVQTEQVPHHIVIIGGGAGGLELATQLGDSFAKSNWVKITLVDQNLTHIWKPLLHEIAAGTLNPSVEEINYFAHASKHHYEFVLGRFVGLDQEHKQVKLEARQYAKQSTETTQFELNYDTLVLAVGSTSNDFATEGAKHYCHFLDSRQQAEIFQQDLLHLYLDAQNRPETRALNIAIIGAGATGVELAAELVHAKSTFFKYGLNKIDPNKVKVTLIEAADRILPALSTKMATHTHTQLEKLGVEVLTHHRVAKLDKDHVYFANGSQIDADLKVWAAGIKAPVVLNALEGFEKDAIGRLKVYATLQTGPTPTFLLLAIVLTASPRPMNQSLAHVLKWPANKRPFCFERLKRAFVISLCRCLNFLTKALWFPSVNTKLWANYWAKSMCKACWQKPCMFLYIDSIRPPYMAIPKLG